jgi:hypothetical protein
MSRLWVDSVPHMLSSHPCCAMFNIFVATLDLTIAGLIGMGIVMEVKEARRRASTRRF